jgi:hypothetical protein
MYAIDDGLDTVLGLFHHEEDADQTIMELVEAGILEECLMVLTQDRILDEISQAGREAIDSGELKAITTEYVNEILGAMLTLIIPHEQALHYTEGMKNGRVLVVAQSLEGLGSIARTIMENSRAVRVDQIHQVMERILLLSKVCELAYF